MGRGRPIRRGLLLRHRVPLRGEWRQKAGNTHERDGGAVSENYSEKFVIIGFYSEKFVILQPLF